MPAMIAAGVAVATDQNPPDASVSPTD
jgi:hypothetical protein